MDLQQTFDVVQDRESVSNLARELAFKNKGTFISWFYDNLGTFHLGGSRKEEGIERVVMTSVYDPVKGKYIAESVGVDWMNLNFQVCESA